MDQYSRLKPLLGSDNLKKLSDKIVIVFGLGGVGGSCVDALARSGIKHFIIVDKDCISVSNINRQLIANLNNLNRPKVDVMEEHLKAINPDIEVVKKEMFYDASKNDEIDFAHCDYIVDCIDSVASKIDLVKVAKTYNKSIISALGCGNKFDPSQLKIGDIFETSYDPLAKVIRHELRKNNIDKLKVVYSLEKPHEFVEEMELEEEYKKSVPASTAFVPPVAGIMMAREVILDLLSLHP